MRARASEGGPAGVGRGAWRDAVRGARLGAGVPRASRRYVGFWAHFSMTFHKGKREDLLWLRSPKITERYVRLLGGLAPICMSLPAPSLRGGAVPAAAPSRGWGSRRCRRTTWTALTAWGCPVCYTVGVVCLSVFVVVIVYCCLLLLIVAYCWLLLFVVVCFCVLLFIAVDCCLLLLSCWVVVLLFMTAWGCPGAGGSREQNSVDVFHRTSRL